MSEFIVIRLRLPCTGIGLILRSAHFSFIGWLVARMANPNMTAVHDHRRFAIIARSIRHVGGHHGQMTGFHKSVMINVGDVGA